MGKQRSGGKKKNGIVKLKSLLLGRKSASGSYCDDNEEVRDSSCVPEDVKEGHFAVTAVEGGEKPERFVVPLSYLTHPAFVRLLEQAAEEYGFSHEGAVTIPCRPSELERILADEQWHAQEERDTDSSIVAVNWGSCETMVQSC